MVSFSLLPHPDTPPSNPAFKLWVNVDHAAAFGSSATLNLFFCVGAPAERFTIPQTEEPGRTDKLWRTTCFEAFLRARGGEPYAEWNFAPSGDWAAYDFTSYRQGMTPADVTAPPYIRMEDNLTWWALGATIAVPSAPTLALGLSAVLEEKDGTKSYWALAHLGGTPDFHHDACFAASLPGMERS
ncbi:MAG: DOMON-like domain-containing protein [Sphingomicrobium sp.]|nr:DOMON-like domain-containing protein [Sphingomonadales bacterium]